MKGYYETCAIPKGEPLKRTRARNKRGDAKGLKAFRDAVWNREGQLFDGCVSSEWNLARCQRCGLVVKRSPWGLTGHVHHRIGRRAKATRYDPANGVLLCGPELGDCHGKVERHEVPCP